MVVGDGVVEVRPGDTSEALQRVGGWGALAGAALAVVYTVSFVVLKDGTLSALSLMAGGLLSAIALVAVYERLRAAAADPGLVLLGLLLGFTGTMGAFIHGGVDLANVLHPEAAGPAGVPAPIDPRGLLTFGVSGLGLMVLSYVGMRTEGLPRRLGWLGIALGVMLIVVYLGRLIILTPSHPLVLGPAGVAAVTSIVWYSLVGLTLLGRRT